MPNTLSHSTSTVAANPEIKIVYSDLAGKDYVLAYQGKPPFAYLPRIGERIYLTDDDQNLVDSEVTDVHWHIDIKTHSYKVFVVFDSTPEKADVKEEDQLWERDFRKALFVELENHVTVRILRYITRAAHKFHLYEQAFLIEGMLPFFDEWANAILDGEITQGQLQLIPQMGPIAVEKLVVGLREWKKQA